MFCTSAVGEVVKVKRALFAVVRMVVPVEGVVLYVLLRWRFVVLVVVAGHGGDDVHHDCMVVIVVVVLIA